MDQSGQAGAPDVTAVAPYVLSEKVRPPAPSGLVRERLERPLAGPDAPGLACVFAPAGAGKTTLLARLAHLSPTPVAWLRLTPSDSDEQQLAAGLARAVRGLVRPTRDSPRGLDDVLEHLDRDADGPGLLVLDDLHTVAGSQAETALERFLGLRPARLRVVVGSRRLPGWDLPQLLMTDSVVRVTGDALRFRYWEVEELFARVYREPLGPEAAAVLTRRTGGWAAGLQLFHLATAGRGLAERRRAVAQLGGRSGLVRSYLVRNVLAELPQQRQDFMVVTSTLGVLTGELCDELLETSGSLHVLEELERAQMFTSSTDDGVTFRYHPVLEAHLHGALVERHGTPGAAEVFRRSAGVLERSAFRQEALLAYARAEDWGAVARLLQEDGSELTVGGLAGGEQLLAAGRLAQDPWLTLSLARLRSRQGDVGAAVDSYRSAEAMLEDRAFRASCQAERAVAAAWLPEAGSRGPASGPRWVDRLRVALRGGRPDAPGPRRPVSGDGTAVPDGTAEDHLATGVTAVLDADLRTARDALEQAEASEDASSTSRAAALLGLALLAVLDDGQDDPLSDLERAVLEAEGIGHPFLARLSTAVMEAHLLPQRPSSAGRSAHERLVTGCRRHHDTWGEALAELCFGLAALQVAPDDARRSLTRASELFVALGADRLSAWSQAGRSLAGSTVEAAATFGSALRELAVQQSGRRHGAASPTGPEPVPGAALRITCLGEFRCEVAGVPLGWGATRPRALRLFRMLALAAPRPLHREQLIEAMWPGSDLDSGARQLHVAVSSLRRVLNGAGLAGAELLSRRGDAYALVVSRGSLDVADLEAALREMDAARAAGDLAGCAAAARTALQVYAGDLLPEDGPADWVVPHRDRLRRGAASAAAVVAAELRRQSDHEAAVAATHRWIDLDPYADPAWELLSGLHEDVGDRAAAARCRQDHGRLLADLGVL